MGAGGHAANRSAIQRCACRADELNDLSCHGEKLWHREAGFGSANCATRHRKPTPNEDAMPRRKRSMEARLG
jgi:hypothetical protein